MDKKKSIIAPELAITTNMTDAKHQLVADIMQLAVKLNFETELCVYVIFVGQTGSFITTIEEWQDDKRIEIARSEVNLLARRVTNDGIKQFESDVVSRLMRVKATLNAFVELGGVDPEYLDEDSLF